MKYGMLLILLLMSFVSQGQFFSIKNVYNSDSTYVFPVFKSLSRQDIAKKINAAIQSSFVEKVNPNTVNPFETVSGEDEYGYDMGANNDRVVSVVISGAHSGAGYHVSSYDYNFDSRTGNTVDLNQLLGADGQARLRRAYHKVWKESIKSNLKDSNFAEAYKECLAGAEKTTEVDITRMQILNDGIRVWGASCLDGSNWQADMTGISRDFSFGQLLPMLTSYGFSLYVSKSATGPLQVLLRGLIDGKYPISLTFLPGQSNAIGGQIVYDRVGQPINLSGTISGNQVVFHELDPSGQPISTIETTWDGTKLSGMFTNLKTNKQLPFLASAVK